MTIRYSIVDYPLPTFTERRIRDFQVDTVTLEHEVIEALEWLDDYISVRERVLPDVVNVSKVTESLNKAYHCKARLEDRLSVFASRRKA